MTLLLVMNLGFAWGDSGEVAPTVVYDSWVAQQRTDWVAPLRDDWVAPQRIDWVAPQQGDE